MRAVHQTPDRGTLRFAKRSGGPLRVEFRSSTVAVRVSLESAVVGSSTECDVQVRSEPLAVLYKKTSAGGGLAFTLRHDSVAFESNERPGLTCRETPLSARTLIYPGDTPMRPATSQHLLINPNLVSGLGALVSPEDAPGSKPDRAIWDAAFLEPGVTDDREDYRPSALLYLARANLEALAPTAR